MSINPNQGQNPNQADPYGTYGGYSAQPTPPSQTNPDDPYNSQWYGQQQSGDAQPTGGGQQYGTGQQQQQYATGQQQQTYQPPRSAYRNSSSSSSASSASSMSMNPRIAALLSVVLVWIGGLFFFIAEKKNRFVRFHAAQSFLFFSSLFIIYWAIGLLGIVGLIPLLGGLLGLLAGFIIGTVHLLLIGIGVVVGLYLAFNAYRGVKTKLPFFGDYAETLVSRFTRS